MTSNGVSAEVMVRALDIRKAFGSTEVLKRVSLDIHKGEVMAVMGRQARAKARSCAA